MWLKLLSLAPMVLKLVSNWTDPAKRKTNYVMKLQKKIDKMERRRDELKVTLDKILTSPPRKHRDFDLTDVHDELLNIQNKLLKLTSKRDNLLRE